MLHKFMKINRKGHLPTFFLIPVALALIIIVLFSFVSFKSDLGGTSAEINNLINDNGLKEAYVKKALEEIVNEAVRNADRDNLIGTFNSSLKNSAEARDPREFFELQSNFFGKIRNNEFDIQESEGIYNLSIENVFVNSELGKSSIKREFNLTIGFNENGIIR